MATQYDPIAKDASLNTTETPSRNIADVIAQSLASLIAAMPATVLNNLADVVITLPTDGQTLKYDAVSQKWVNADDAGGHTIEGADGTSLSQEPTLQFADADASDDAVNEKTVVNVVRERTQAQYDAMSAADKAKGIIEINDANAKPLFDTQVRLSSGSGTVADILEYDSQTYPGRDLTVVFAGEIANYADEWAWVQARLNANNINGLHIGDYIPVTVSANTTDNIPAETHQMEIAGIDTYYRTGDSGHEVKHHIDWISRNCYSGAYQFNTTNNNNGTSAQPNPFLASDLKTKLDGTIYPLLPTKVRNVIKTKRVYAPTRPSGTDDSGNSFLDFDKLWILFEYEVFDCTSWSTKGFGNGQSVQYPIFANRYEHRMKTVGNTSTLASWWTASATSGDNSRIINVNAQGRIANYGGADFLNVPICFRTMED